MFDWITRFIQDHGYAGIAVLMLAENVFPPIPSELVMPLAGFTATRGELVIALAVAAGAAGSLAGALFWYWVGAAIGAERLKRWSIRHGRWLALAPRDVDQACAWFARHGGKAVLLGRLVPGVRSLISVPAGIAGMPLAPFLAYSALGIVAWSALLAAAGYLLESEYHAVAGWLNPVANAVIAALAGIYLYRVWTFGRRVRRG